MENNYHAIIQNNLKKLFTGDRNEIAEHLPADRDGDTFVFRAFGKKCVVTPERVTIGGEVQTGVPGILITLYALHRNTEPCRDWPFRAFREFPDSMPYVGAFKTHCEQILIPHVENIEKAQARIEERFGKKVNPPATGDFSLVLQPLPKISLAYVFYMADDDFPASVTCLFSNNADAFMPIDGLADVGEYSSKEILKTIGVSG